MADRPGSPENDTQWRTAGDRIQTILDSCAASGASAYERAQELVREVVGLYGAGLERIMALGDAGMPERLVTDDLVASLLLVHGLHPHDVRRRVSDALDRVRPYLGSHGGDVDLLDVSGDTVRLAFTGSCPFRHVPPAKLNGPPCPFGTNPRSSIAMISAMVKQSCTSAN